MKQLWSDKSVEINGPWQGEWLAICHVARRGHFYAYIEVTSLGTSLCVSLTASRSNIAWRLSLLSAHFSWLASKQVFSPFSRCFSGQYILQRVQIVLRGKTNQSNLNKNCFFNAISGTDFSRSFLNRKNQLITKI